VAIAAEHASRSGYSQYRHHEVIDPELVRFSLAE